MMGCRGYTASTAKLYLHSVQMPTTRVSRAGKGISLAENVEKTNICMVPRATDNVRKRATFFATLLLNELKSYGCALDNQTSDWTKFWGRELLHTRELRHLPQNEFVLGRFCCKLYNYSLLSATTFRNLQQIRQI